MMSTITNSFLLCLLATRAATAHLDGRIPSSIGVAGSKPHRTTSIKAIATDADADATVERKLLNSMSNGLRHFALNRIDEDMNEHQRNRRRLLYREKRNTARLLWKPPKSQTGKPKFPKHKIVPYKGEGTLTREPDGVYYTVVRIGTNIEGNGIPFTLIADTGSSTIAVPCKGCDCGATKHYFDPKGSKTARDIKQRYNQCYGEGSCNSGKKLKDIMCFGPKCESTGGVAQSFGCCTKYAPSFQEQVADGIIGLGHSNTLVKALQDSGELLAHQFALCVGPDKGRLTVGGCELINESWTFFLSLAVVFLRDMFICEMILIFLMLSFSSFFSSFFSSPLR